jgi:hypothetical protein
MFGRFKNARPMQLRRKASGCCVSNQDLGAGHPICAIAGALQRAKSTIPRELRRNALPSGRYSPLHAAGFVRHGFDQVIEKAVGYSARGTGVKLGKGEL